MNAVHQLRLVYNVHKNLADLAVHDRFDPPKFNLPTIFILAYLLCKAAILSMFFLPKMFLGNNPTKFYCQSIVPYGVVRTCSVQYYTSV